jgi:death-on-curing protein
VTSYPTVEEAIAVRAQLIARFGGSLGIRDRGALESALARPQSGYYHDIIQEAAALWESLSQNHPFVDGNKRVAATVDGSISESERISAGIRRLRSFLFPYWPLRNPQAAVQGA